MADLAKTRNDWETFELDLVVADYFAMLRAELNGQKYVKSHHRRALLAKLSRTNGSLEFKHQNISAALEQLGLPWIAGYLPRPNYQDAIFPAIDRYLSQHPDLLAFVPEVLQPPQIADDIFVPIPQTTPDEKTPEPLRQLVRKFDPIERDQRNRKLGEAGERFVLELERLRLTDASQPSLARKVRWISSEDGDGAGFDILSFDPRTGDERLIEVKTTNGSARTPFFLSRNELATSEQRPSEWRIYRVHLFASTPRIFTLIPPLRESVHLAAHNWRASFGA